MFISACAKKIIFLKESKLIYQAKEISKEVKPSSNENFLKSNVVLKQIPIETQKQWITKSNKIPFVPYIKSYASRMPKQVWVPKSV